MSVLDFIIAALATFRLTRLITTDQITERFREWAELRSEWTGYLTTCDWCSSIWIGLPVGLALHAAPDALLVRWPLTGLALSAVAGLLSQARSGL